MQVTLEFTVEPFVDGQPGPHVQAALDALTDAGLNVEMGPFGNTATGELADVAEAVSAALRRAGEAGASRISLQLTTTNDLPAQ